MEDPYHNMDPAEYFNLLESNQLQAVEDIKALIHEHLNSTKEAWLVQGLVDYSMAKGSLRAMEILLGLRESHSKHLFDKLSESLRSNTTKLSTLIFMGFLVRKQPQWLHRISSHYVMRDLMKILKTDPDVIVLVNALLVLTALIPIIPNLEPSILNDIFESFSRLAAWNYSNQPKQPEVYVLHLQIALYALFHRLYGMYPCNFLSYLRQQYAVRENLPIFSHTVKPMVETVRMHPLLVTASKDIEIGTARWKQMSVHDIVAECAKYSLLECQEVGHREDTVCSSLVHSYTPSVEPTPTPQPASWLTDAMNPAGEWNSPGRWVTYSTAPKVPLSRVVTPKMDQTELAAKQQQMPQPSSSVARTLNLTPTASPLPLPPTSPLKKDLPPFKYPVAGSSAIGDLNSDRRSAVIGVKLQKLGQDQPSTSFAHFGPVLSGMRSRHSSGAVDTRKSLMSPAAVTEPLNTPTPKQIERERDIISAEDREVCRLLSAKLSKESEAHVMAHPSMQSREGTPLAQPPSRPDSLLQEKIDYGRHDESELDETHQLDDDERHHDETVHSGHTPCQSGGLHMPDHLRISDFVQRVKRLRYFSQCLPMTSGSTGSPGSGSSIGTMVDSSSFGQTGTSLKSATVHMRQRKRSVSCPNLLQMESEPATAGLDGVKEEPASSSSAPDEQKSSIACQTDPDLWPPTPYEHLFFSVLPPSLLFPPPAAPAEPEHRPPGPSEVLDRYIDSAFRNHERNVALLGKPNATEDVALLKGQVLLLQSQLQFERHRREIHAERNRRLLAKLKGMRLVEEELHTLRLQLSQNQNEMMALRRDADNLRRQRNAAEADRAKLSAQYEADTKRMLKEIQEATAAKSRSEDELASARDEARALKKDADRLNGRLFETEAEMAELRRRANDSRRYQQELKEAQYNLIAARETVSLLQQQVASLPAPASAKFEMDEMTRCFRDEVKALTEKLERERRQSDALAARLTDMESAALRRETDMSDMKRLIQSVNDEHQQLMKVAEQKYESVKSINLSLESAILQLRHQVEIGKSRQSRRRQIAQMHDPSPTSAGPAQSSMAAGFSASPGSPPSFSSISGASNDQLSVSLAVEASEGLNELYWQGLESTALVEAADLPLESVASPVPEHQQLQRRRSSVASASGINRQ